MHFPLRILHLEDSPRDAEIIRNKIESGGMPCDVLRVETEAQFNAALAGEVFDLILCDYNLPDFDGLDALVRALDQQPDTPVLLISGTLGEDKAVQCLQLGATDYLLKARLDRLPAAVKRALAEAENHRQCRQAEAALREREAMLQILTSQAHVGMVMVTSDRRYVFANAAYAEMLGLASAALVGQRVPEVLAPVYESQIRPRLDRAFAGERVAYELTLPPREAGKGERCFAINYDPPVATSHGPCVVVVVVDITERKQAEQAVQASQRVLQLVLDHIPQGVFWKDRDSRYLGCNAVVAQSFGVPTAAAIVGKLDRDLGPLTPEQVAFFVQKDREVMASNQPQLGIIEQSTFADGVTRWLETNKLPMHSPTGEVIGVLGTWQDITQRRLAEEVLQRRAAELEQFHRLSVGRELQMVELKKEVNTLAQKLGQPPPYDLSFLEKSAQPKGRP